MTLPKAAALGRAVRRLAGERPTAHVDLRVPDEGWRGGDVVTLWPNPELVGVDPGERWVRLSTGADALFLRAHDWAPAELSRYLAVRLVEEGPSAVRAVEHGCLPLAAVVALLRPAEAHRLPRLRSSRAESQLRAVLGEAAAVAFGGLAILAAGWAAAGLAITAAVR